MYLKYIYIESYTLKILRLFNLMSYVVQQPLLITTCGSLRLWLHKPYCPGRKLKSAVFCSGHPTTYYLLLVLLTPRDGSQSQACLLWRIEPWTSCTRDCIHQSTSYCKMQVTTISKFEPVMVFEITKLLKVVPSNSCMLDPIPTWLLKQVTTSIAPVICHLCNLSMQFGKYPTLLKQARVPPLFKNRTRKVVIAPCVLDQIPSCCPPLCANWVFTWTRADHETARHQSSSIMLLPSSSSTSNLSAVWDRSDAISTTATVLAGLSQVVLEAL